MANRTGIPWLKPVAIVAFFALGVVVLLTRPGVMAQEPPASSTVSEASVHAEIDSPATDPRDDVPESCPITVVGENGFIPASDAPDGPSSVYDTVWYGSPELWTMIDPNGEVWRDLPVGTDGSLTQKWLWWSDRLSSEDSAEITITAEHLDGTAPTVEVRGSGGASSSPTSPSFGRFMVTGIELPERGCWRVTGHYRDASLGFVVWIAND